jgi:hypothetical protein
VQVVIDGKQRIEEERVQGESLPILAQESVLLTLGNAGAVEIQANGQTVEHGKASKEVLRDFLISLETLRDSQTQDKKEAS